MFTFYVHAHDLEQLLDDVYSITAEEGLKKEDKAIHILRNSVRFHQDL
jgi:hypothetical protein